MSARLAQLQAEREALEERRAKTARDLEAAKAALELRRADRAKLQDESRRTK